MARNIHFISCDFTRALLSFFVFSSVFFFPPFIYFHDSFVICLFISFFQWQICILDARFTPSPPFRSNFLHFHALSGQFGWIIDWRVPREILDPPLFFIPFFTGRNEVVAKVIFLHLSVILFTRWWSASLHAGIPPCQGDPLLPRRPPAKETPLPRRPPPTKETPLPRRPPTKETPLPRRPPPGEADSGIRSMSGRYASYWNAFLFFIVLSFYSSFLFFSIHISFIHSTIEVVYTVRIHFHFLPNHLFLCIHTHMTYNLRHK